LAVHGATLIRRHFFSELHPSTGYETSKNIKETVYSEPTSFLRYPTRTKGDVLGVTAAASSQQRHEPNKRGPRITPATNPNVSHTTGLPLTSKKHQASDDVDASNALIPHLFIVSITLRLQVCFNSHAHLPKYSYQISPSASHATLGEFGISSPMLTNSPKERRTFKI
jgi:hypothetical protein